MSYLIKVTEQYRCDGEDEAQKLIEEAKHDRKYTVIKSSSEIKTVKSKGEIIDSWRRVIITKEFNEEKEPDSYMMPHYTEGDFNEDE
jgi:hypothetical protein